MDDKNKIFSQIFYLAVIAVLVLLALQKVHDTDVWLHLGLGQYIVEHRALPAGDIFSYTSYGMPFEYFEWLFEVGLYLLYHFWGYHGLMFFKLSLWLITMSLLWQYMKVEGVESRWAAFLTVFPAYMLIIRWLERPEVMGYFFLTVYLLALALYRRQRRNYLYFLPALQILWINLHPSALLGIMVLLVFLTGESLDYLWDKRKAELRVIKALAIMVPLLVGASFINPYGYKLVINPIIYSQEKVYRLGITEWMPIWRFTTPYYIYLAFLIPAVLSFIPRFFRPRENLKILDLLLFAFAAALPFVSVRNTAIFAVLAIPLAAKNFYWFFSSEMGNQDLILKWRQKLAGLNWAWPVAVLLIGGVLFGLSPKRGVFGWGAQEAAVPQKAVAFVKSNAVPGPLFNYYIWGGYLILEAYPQYLVYIDSGAFDVEIFKEYSGILLARPGWEKKLKERRVNLIMISALTLHDGSVWPLVSRLMQDPGWALIWSGEGALVFLKNHPENRPWLERFTLPKSQICEEIIFESRYLIKTANIKRQTYASMAWAYLMQGNFAEARRAYEEHLKLNPQDQATRNYLDFLRKQGYGR